MVQCRACRVDEVLRQIHQLARQAGGRCLSEQYAGRGTPLQFLCKAGRAFEKTAENLRKGSWCVLCARAQHSRCMADPHGMTRMRAAARARGGKCLSTGYTKLTERYRFRCAVGHEWETSGTEIVRGAWCRICSDREKVHAYRHRDGLARLRERAKSHGGVCLSKVYEGSKAYCRFRCGADQNLSWCLVRGVSAGLDSLWDRAHAPAGDATGWLFGGIGAQYVAATRPSLGFI